MVRKAHELVTICTEVTKLGVLDYAHGVYGIGRKSKGKGHKGDYSTTAHINEHLEC